MNKEYLKQAFDIMDIDGNGMIDKEEIKACFTKNKMGIMNIQGVPIDNKFYDKILKSIDSNNDGYVEFAEFEHHMMKMVDGSPP